MDHELLTALCLLWFASTWGLFAAAFMFVYNEGEAFHPHCVDMDRRHHMYSVVGAKTTCKRDFAVKSISEFIAPRGSTSDKQFTVFLIVAAVAGFLGSLRWIAVGDATFLEGSLCQAGFLCLIIVAMFEVDVSSKLFLEEKLLVTSWLLEKLDMQKHLQFEMSQYEPKLLEFIRESDGLRHMFEEDDGKLEVKAVFFNFNFSMHALGASGYVFLVTAAIILNEIHEEKVAWITGASFFMFMFFGYLTGSYIPIFHIFKAWLLLWNPFLREPDFLLKLQEAVNDYCSRRSADSSGVIPSSPALRTRSRSRRDIATAVVSREDIERNAKQLLDNHTAIRWAWKHPQLYLLTLSHVIMVVELASLMTPIIAVGIQWITSLCDTMPPVTALLSVFYLMLQCMFKGEEECSALQDHCIVSPAGVFAT